MYFHLTPSPIPSKKCIIHKKQASNNLLFDDGKAVFYLRILPKSSRWKLQGNIIQFLHLSDQFIFSIKLGDKLIFPDKSVDLTPTR